MKPSLPLLTALLLAPLGTLNAADDMRELWDASVTLPKTADIPALKGVRFPVIKPYEIQKDGYRFLHGEALAWHKRRFFAPSNWHSTWRPA